MGRSAVLYAFIPGDASAPPETVERWRSELAHEFGGAVQTDEDGLPCTTVEEEIALRREGAPHPLKNRIPEEKIGRPGTWLSIEIVNNYFDRTYPRGIPLAYLGLMDWADRQGEGAESWYGPDDEALREMTEREVTEMLDAAMSLGRYTPASTPEIATAARQIRTLTSAAGAERERLSAVLDLHALGTEHHMARWFLRAHALVERMRARAVPAVPPPRPARIR